MNYASFWIRILAGLIDNIILLPVELLRIHYVSHTWKAYLVADICYGVYYVFFWVRYSATPGMMMMGIRLIRKGQFAITAGKAILRYFGAQISAFTIIGGLWMLWDKNRQMWHDKLAQTFVVKSPGTKKITGEL